MINLATIWTEAFDRWRHPIKILVKTLGLASLLLLAEPGVSPADSPAMRVGTLVVLVPFNDGLLVAADSRTTIYNTEQTKPVFCDGIEKIIHADGSQTAAVVTGLGSVVVIPDFVTPSTVCEYIKSAPKYLDIEYVVRKWLEASDAPLESRDLSELFRLAEKELQRAAITNPGYLNQLRDNNLFQIVLASYNRTDRKSVIRSLRAVIGRADAAPGTAILFGPGPVNLDIPSTFRGSWHVFGELDYLKAQVMGDAGKAFYNPALAQRIETRRIPEISREDAKALASHVIDASSKTSEVVPPPSGIGGPTSMVELGGGLK